MEYRQLLALLMQQPAQQIPHLLASEPDSRACAEGNHHFVE